MTLFATDSETVHFAVVIVRNRKAIFTANARDLAIKHLREQASHHDELEVREVVTTVTSRRSFRPSRRLATAETGPACPVDNDLSIPERA